jgi:hypothetical protein
MPEALFIMQIDQKVVAHDQHYIQKFIANKLILEYFLLEQKNE